MKTENSKNNRSESFENISALKLEYESKLREQKDRIFELVDEEKKLKAELEAYKNKDKLIEATLVNAEEKAEEIRATANLKYNCEINFLNNFHEKWTEYFEYLSKTYPLYNATKEATEIEKKLEEILGKKINGKEKIEELDLAISKVISFNPRKKVENYLQNLDSSENNFSMNEVLNPGQLNLEDLCKELGVMESK